MKLLKSFIITLFLIIPSEIWALEFPWLTFKMTDSSELSVAADGLTISCADCVLLLNSDKVNQSLPLNQIQSMRFTSEHVSLHEISSAMTCPAEYYTVQGTAAGRFESIDQARAALPSGVYIGKSESGNFKVIF